MHPRALSFLPPVDPRPAFRDLADRRDRVRDVARGAIEDGRGHLLDVCARLSRDGVAFGAEDVELLADDLVALGELGELALEGAALRCGPSRGLDR